MELERDDQQPDDDVRQGQVGDEEVGDGLKHTTLRRDFSPYRGSVFRVQSVIDILFSDSSDLHAAAGEDDEDDGGVAQDRGEGGGAVHHGEQDHHSDLTPNKYLMTFTSRYELLSTHVIL